jgi:hypothetical protein
VNESDEVAHARRLGDQRTHRLSRGHVDRRDAHLVASVRHDIGCRFRVGLAAVGEHDVLSDSDPARDGLTDLAGSDDDNDVPHACTSVIS